MHEESKLKRAKIQDMTRKRLRQPKVADKSALDKFKAVPYQSMYAENVRKEQICRK